MKTICQKLHCITIFGRLNQCNNVHIQPPCHWEANNSHGSQLICYSNYFFLHCHMIIIINHFEIKFRRSYVKQDPCLGLHSPNSWMLAQTGCKDKSRKSHREINKSLQGKITRQISKSKGLKSVFVIVMSL